MSDFEKEGSFFESDAYDLGVMLSRPTVFFLISLIVSFSPFFSGCNSTQSTSRYPTTPTGMAKDLEGGTIVDIREVIIDGRTSGVGTATGTLSGAVAGSQIGGSLGDPSSGAATGAAGGAIAGAVIGPKVEKALTSKRAQELTVRMDTGGLIVVTQELRKPWFNIGDPVKVDTSLSGAGRVYHANEDPYIDPDTGAYLPEDFEIPAE